MSNDISARERNRYGECGLVFKLGLRTIGNQELGGHQYDKEYCRRINTALAITWAFLTDEPAVIANQKSPKLHLSQE